MRLKVVKTLWFLVTAIIRQTPVNLPELKMAVLAGCDKDSTVGREGNIMDDLWRGGEEGERDYTPLYHFLQLLKVLANSKLHYMYV